MIIIIDYALGNVRSIYAKLSQMGEEVKISNNNSDIKNADKLILPGVGSFDRGMNNLYDIGITDVLKNKIINEKTPVLGICLGMQLFTQKSQEGSENGLGLIDAETIKFKSLPYGYPIPHMGWNIIDIKKECDILGKISNHSRFYFVHSFHLTCNTESEIVASTPYGYDFPSIVQHDNIFGVQFHPEKSHSQGLQILRNFARY
jgi:imidazole glycerol-phosphate synthase subunit HisH